MYLRFVSPLKSGRRGLHMGIFQAAMTCRDDVDMPAYPHKHLIEEIDWFKEHLPSPDEDYFGPRYVGGYHWESICWFKSTAKTMISHAWQLRALVEDCGMPLSLLTSRAPGHISYEDRYQIVAYPEWRSAVKFR